VRAVAAGQAGCLSREEETFTMNIVHLTASTFLGGPERQMLGLAHHLPPEDTSSFLSFAEGGRSRAFLTAVRRDGFEAVALANDTPRFFKAIREIAETLGRLQADVLLCHGYKANLLGRRAARRCGIPAVAVSRGWTGESFRVRWYERLDRFHLRWMDHVVCVSNAQSLRVRRAGVRPERVTVIPNAVDAERFTDPDPRYRAKLERYFRTPRSRIIAAAGRLSPEKGFHVLVEAAARLLENDPTLGFILFGQGDCRAHLLEQVRAAGLGGAFVLGGFRSDLERFMPHLDLFVLPSFTEGMPNVVLEAFAGGVPVVATAVGGTPEVVEDGVSGHLVPPGDPDALAEAIHTALSSDDNLRELGFQGRQRVLENYSFSFQAAGYRALFAQLCRTGHKPTAGPPATPTQELVPAEPTCEP
jgi:glycosyltransferase involved in cell wall biosynthesis